MNAKQRDQFVQRLDQIAEQLERDRSSVLEGARQPSGQAAGELSNAPMHLGDMGTEEYLRDLNATLLLNEEYLVAEVRAALGRLKDGTFGTCESCDRPIAGERLEAIPYARYCIACAAKMPISGVPRINLDDGRPRRPSETLAPEGDMDENRAFREDVPPSDFEGLSERDVRIKGDIYAAGTPGGGTALGGLAGSNVGSGDPEIADLDEAAGSGNFDRRVDQEAEGEWIPQSGRSGGAVGGTPAFKRTRGAPNSRPQA
jgi:RNA polymerase-binding transcription factor DksA